jgi:hypothetical protein
MFWVHYIGRLSRENGRVDCGEGDRAPGKRTGRGLRDAERVQFFGGWPIRV